MDVRRRFNVTETGLSGAQPMVFAHGYATNQGVWRHVAPAFEPDFRVVRFDHLGAGESDLASWDAERHASLHGYAEDVVELLVDLELWDVVYVGHSVGGVIGALAAARAPERFNRLVMVGPSARFLDDAGYVGGFTREELDGVLGALDSDFQSWAQAMAPVLAGDEAADELESLMRTAPAETTPSIGRTVLLADHRDDFAHVPVPALVMQASRDPLVPVEVGRFIERRLPDGHFVQLAATGHFPNLTAPNEVIAAIRAFL